MFPGVPSWAWNPILKLSTISQGPKSLSGSNYPLSSRARLNKIWRPTKKSTVLTSTNIKSHRCVCVCVWWAQPSPPTSSYKFWPDPRGLFFRPVSGQSSARWILLSFESRMWEFGDGLSTRVGGYGFPSEFSIKKAWELHCLSEMEGKNN